MNQEITDLLFGEFKDFQILKIENGASLRNYYRLIKNGKSAILMDSSKESHQFINFLNVYKILSKIKISIPEIYEIDSNRSILILEDFGDLRFDKILNLYYLKNLLSIAIDSLIQIKKEITFNHSYNLSIYNYNAFENEISEFIDFFYPYYQKNNISVDLKKEFFDTWKSEYNLLDLNFGHFVHKDYNMNNLIYLPNKKKHYKCGIIDFQNSFWGEDCWDLFSLLEDSRIYFDDQNNEYFINYYCVQTNQKASFTHFYDKYNFFNCSRQTRLLGRWVKLSKIFNQKWYFDFIEITNKRLIKSLQRPSMIKFKSLYNKLIPDLYDL